MIQQRDQVLGEFSLLQMFRPEKFYPRKHPIKVAEVGLPLTLVRELERLLVGGHKSKYTSIFVVGSSL